MLGGIKTTIDGDHCLHCNTKIISNYDFCPKCGSPISYDALRLKEQQNKAIKLELLDELSSMISDEKSLKVILEKTKKI